jgi:hypothetical protein
MSAIIVIARDPTYCSSYADVCGQVGRLAIDGLREETGQLAASLCAFTKGTLV